MEGFGGEGEVFIMTHVPSAGECRQILASGYFPTRNAETGTDNPTSAAICEVTGLTKDALYHSNVFPISSTAKSNGNVNYNVLKDLITNGHPAAVRLMLEKHLRDIDFIEREAAAGNDCVLEVVFGRHANFIHSFISDLLLAIVTNDLIKDR